MGPPIFSMSYKLYKYYFFLCRHYVDASIMSIYSHHRCLDPATKIHRNLAVIYSSTRNTGQVVTIEAVFKPLIYCSETEVLHKSYTRCISKFCIWISLFVNIFPLRHLLKKLTDKQRLYYA